MTNLIFLRNLGRPALLYLTLESLNECRKIDDYQIAVRTPEKSDKCFDIVDNFFPDAEILFRENEPKIERVNFCRGLQELTSRTDDYLIHLEDDVRVSRDLLEFLDSAYQDLLSPEIFAIRGIRYSGKQGQLEKDDVSKVLERKGVDVLCTLFPKNILEEYILPHCCEEYYTKTEKYCEREFGVKRALDGHGLMGAIRKKEQLRVLVPYVDRAKHIGIYSTKSWRSMEEVCPFLAEKNLDERIDLIREIINDEKRLNELRYEDRRSEIEKDYKWKTLYLEEGGE